MDYKKQIQKAAANNELILGLKEVEKALKSGEGKLVVISDNCPETEMIKHYANLSKVKVENYPGSSYELGALAKVPFSVSVLMVK